MTGKETLEGQIISFDILVGMFVLSGAFRFKMTSEKGKLSKTVFFSWP